MIFNEETADFQKLLHIEDEQYIESRKLLARSSKAQQPQHFIAFCQAVIEQKNQGALTIRESAYAISDWEEVAPSNRRVATVIEHAIALRRHPANYKRDHQVGWARLVKRIENLQEALVLS